MRQDIIQPLASSLTKIEHVGAVTKVGSQEPVLPQELEEIRQYFIKELPTLLLLGSSAGAKVFNDFVSQNQRSYTDRSVYNIINLTGSDEVWCACLTNSFLQSLCDGPLSA